MAKCAIVGMGYYSQKLPGLGALDYALYNGMSLTDSPIEAEFLLKSVEEALGQAGYVSNYHARIAVITTSQSQLDITQLQLSGPLYQVQSGDNAVFQAIAQAQVLFQNGQAEAVLLVGQHEAVVLKPYPFVQQTRQPIYAILESPTFAENLAGISAAIQTATESAGISPEQLGYLEFGGRSIGQEDAAELPELLKTFQNISPFQIAAGGKGESGLVSLIKTVLSLYHRYIPAIPDWTRPYGEGWQDSPFYIAGRSRGWFMEKGQNQRFAAISSLAPNNSYAYLLLSEAENPAQPDYSYLEQLPLQLFPLAGNDRESLLASLKDLSYRLTESSSVAQLAEQCFQTFQANPASSYAVALLAKNWEGLAAEIESALAGVANAFDKGRDWKSKQGSYFSPNPLGAKGEVAFVYPGAFNSFIGLGQDLFKLYPDLYERFAKINPDLSGALAAKQLYPRSLEALSEAQLDEQEAQLEYDPATMIQSGASFAILFTMLVRDYFKVKPRATFGYSMGETSMFWATGVWQGGKKGLDTFQDSTLFRTRLVGPKDSVREQWGIPAETEGVDFWSTYYILAPVEKVQEGLKGEERVYLTHINTPEEVIISGDTAGCKRVIERLKCHFLRRPASFVMHCPPALAEYNELVKLHSHPARVVSGLTFYSAADYRPVSLSQREIARSVSRMICQQLDFPRLVKQVYQDGSRIFVELGPGNTCSRWIGKILKNTPHAVYHVAQKGTDDQTSLLKLLAQLVSQRVPLDLSLLYGQGEQIRPVMPTLRLPLEKLQEQVSLRSEIHSAFLQNRKTAVAQFGQLVGQQISLLKAQAQQSSGVQVLPRKPALFDRDKLEEFAAGSVVKCFGPDYAIYEGRRLSRIPNSDLLLMSRITSIEGQRGKFEGVSTIEAEYDVPLNAWFYQHNSHPTMPYSVIMEIALQPCGFLAAYKGSALLFPNENLYFRNLDGRAELIREADVRGKTITTRARLLVTTALNGTIIQRFDFELSCEGQPFYRGESAFGFFPAETMINQVGLDGGKVIQPWYVAKEQPGELVNLQAGAPLLKAPPGKPHYRLASGQLEFLDEVRLIPGGGKFGQGYVFARKQVNPADWFYRCHFYQDPVMPGSLGIEAILEAMQVYALKQDLGAGLKSPHFEPLSGHSISWKYRGQLLLTNREMQLEVHLSRVERLPGRVNLIGEASLWKDNVRIYEIKEIGLCLKES